LRAAAGGARKARAQRPEPGEAVPGRDYNGPNTIGKSWENHRKIFYGPILPLPGINGVIISETKVNNITQMNSNDFF